MTTAYVVRSPDGSLIAEGVNILDAATAILTHNGDSFALHHDDGAWFLMINSHTRQGAMVMAQCDDAGGNFIFSLCPREHHAWQEIASYVVAFSHNWRGSPVATEVGAMFS